MLILGSSVNTRGILRNIDRNNNAQASAMEKLSSGLRINKAADDPAGLVISEQLRSQIAGLERAIENTEHADNILSITDGALGTVQSVLTNMRKLTVQAANVGVSSPDQTAALQAEMDASLQSIERIMETTNVAGRKLMDEMYSDGTLGRVPEKDPKIEAENEKAAKRALEEAGEDGQPGWVNELMRESNARKPALSDVIEDGVPRRPESGSGASEAPAPGSPEEQLQMQIDALSRGDKATYDTAKRLQDLGLSSIGGITLPGLGGILPPKTLTMKDLYSGGAAALGNDPIAAMRIVEQASKDISTERAKIGATMSLRANERAAMEAAVENVTRTESGIRDADMASTMVELVQSQIVSQSGMKVLDAAMDQSKAMLRLLEW